MSLPPPREGSRDTREGLIISKFPDVCRSPKCPVPYTIVAYQSDDANTAASVRMTGQRAHKQNSIVTRCTGDEPGTGLGVKSNTVSSVCHRKEHSSTVRIEGRWATRHGDAWYMNNRNTVGKLNWHTGNKSFDPTPPIRYASLADDVGDTATQTDADLDAAVDHAFAMAAAGSAQAAPQSAPANPVPRPSAPNPITPRNPQPGRAPSSPKPPVNDNLRPKPGMIARWWKRARTALGMAAAPEVAAGAAAATAPAAAIVGVGTIGIMRQNSYFEDMARSRAGLPPVGRTLFTRQRLELDLYRSPPPLPAPSENAREEAIKRWQEEQRRRTPQAQSDAPPGVHARTENNVSIEEKERRKRCRVLPYKVLQGTCQQGEQAHHIVPDYTLRYGTRPEGMAGYKRIGDKGRKTLSRSMTPFPSFLDGPAICLKGHAKDDGSEHWEAHGADKVIAAMGAKPGDINPVGTARIGNIKTAAADHTANARPECEPEILAAVQAAFPDAYDNRLGRTTESLPRGEALRWLTESLSGKS